MSAPTDLALVLRVLRRSGQRHEVTRGTKTTHPLPAVTVEVWQRRDDGREPPMHIYFDEASGTLLDFHYD